MEVGTFNTRMLTRELLIDFLLAGDDEDMMNATTLAMFVDSGKYVATPFVIQDLVTAMMVTTQGVKM